MNNKIAIVAVVVVAVVVIAAAAVIVMNPEEENASAKGIVFHGNGATLDDGGKSIAYNSHTITDINPFSYKDHVLIEWNTAKDGSGTAYHAGDYVKYDERINLYAIWGYEFKLVDFDLYGLTGYINIVDSKGNYTPVLSTSTALPTEGAAAVAFYLKGSTGWTINEDKDTFTGIDANGKTVKIKFDLQGATIQGVNIQEGMPAVLITYDGPIKASIHRS